MANTFFISDTHFGHANILTFKGEDGELIRPGFESIEHMNHFIVQKWNSVVRKQDTVIHCGDVAFGSKNLHEWVHRCNGRKILIMGNHDNLKIIDYGMYFSKICGVRYLANDFAICTHIPICETSLRKFKINIHGHLHEKPSPTNLHFNVSCEQLNYTPIELEEIKEIHKC